MYRVGLPGWRLAGRWGVPLRVRVFAHYDKESQSFWANSPDLDGLVVSGATLDELRTEAIGAAEVLLELAVNGHTSHAVTDLRVRDALPCAA